MPKIEETKKDDESKPEVKAPDKAIVQTTMFPDDKPKEETIPDARFDWQSLGGRVRVREGQGVICVDISKVVAQKIGSHYGKYDIVRIAFNPNGELSVSHIDKPS